MTDCLLLYPRTYELMHNHEVRSHSNEELDGEDSESAEQIDD